MPSRADGDDPLTTAFAGTPDFAARVLARLIHSPYRPKLVLTQPDRPSGRGGKGRGKQRPLVPSPVKELALGNAIDIAQPEGLRRANSGTAALARLQPDTLIVAAYGLILPESVLAVPVLGCLNVHASLLPRWRGAAPVERAMIAGDAVTGVSIMRMEEGLDTGPVYAALETPVREDESAAQLTARLAELGADALLEVLDAFAAAKRGARPPPLPTPQNDARATYARKLTSADRTVDWAEAESAARKIRTLADRSPVVVVLGDVRAQLLEAVATESFGTGPAGTIVRADETGLYVQCATGTLQVTKLKLNRGQGKPLDAAEALRGFGEYFQVGRSVEQ